MASFINKRKTGVLQNFQKMNESRYPANAEEDERPLLDSEDAASSQQDNEIKKRNTEDEVNSPLFYKIQSSPIFHAVLGVMMYLSYPLISLLLLTIVWLSYAQDECPLY